VDNSAVRRHSLLSSLAYAAILVICAQSGLCFMLANILVVGGCDVGVFAAVAATWRQKLWLDRQSYIKT